MTRAGSAEWVDAHAEESSYRALTAAQHAISRSCRPRAVPVVTARHYYRYLVRRFRPAVSQPPLETTET
jgi:hypothetical protein